MHLVGFYYKNYQTHRGGCVLQMGQFRKDNRNTMKANIWKDFNELVQKRKSGVMRVQDSSLLLLL
jgi:hypothetical protein